MKKWILPLFCLFQIHLFAQDSTKVRLNPLRNGGIFGSVEYSVLRLDYAPFVLDTLGTMGRISVKNGVSLSAGIFYKKKIANWLIIRPALGASFSTGRLAYDLNKLREVYYDIHPLTANLQLHFMIPAGYLRNRMPEPDVIRGFTPIIGPSVFIPVEQIPTIHPEVKNYDVHLDFGFGYQWENKQMKSHIDMIYSLGLVNLIGVKDDVYTNPVQSLYRDSFSIRYYFH